MPQILNIDDTGQKLYEDYVSERINGDVSLWAPVKKEKNMMYMSGNKKHTVKVRDKTADLKESKDLHGRLMVLARLNRDIDQKLAVGTYEFTLTPRSLFAPDGSVLPCSDKSKLIHALENMVATDTDHADQQEQSDESTHSRTSHADNCQKIAVVDGMVLVQKAAAVVTVKDLSVCFNDRLMNLTRHFTRSLLSLTHTGLTL